MDDAELKRLEELCARDEATTSYSKSLDLALEMALAFPAVVAEVRRLRNVTALATDLAKRLAACDRLLNFDYAHDDGCAWVPGPTECDCGLAKSLAAARQLGLIPEARR